MRQLGETLASSSRPVQCEVRVAGELAAGERVAVQVVVGDDLVVVDERARRASSAMNPAPPVTKTRLPRRAKRQPSASPDWAARSPGRLPSSGSARTRRSSIARAGEERPFRRCRPTPAPRDQRARERGLRVVAVDRDQGAPGFAEADGASWSTSPQIASLLAALADEPLEGVLTIASDRAVMAVAAVAEARGLPGIGTETARLMTHKVAMRRALAEEGRAPAALRRAAQPLASAVEPPRGSASPRCSSPPTREDSAASSGSDRSTTSRRTCQRPLGLPEPARRSSRSPSRGPR